MVLWHVTALYAYKLSVGSLDKTTNMLLKAGPQRQPLVSLTIYVFVIFRVDLCHCCVGSLVSRFEVVDKKVESLIQFNFLSISVLVKLSSECLMAFAVLCLYLKHS